MCVEEGGEGVAHSKEDVPMLPEVGRASLLGSGVLRDCTRSCVRSGFVAGSGCYMR